MAHDVFISYATADKIIADAVCATLEQRGARCWIAPRDVFPGRDWAGAIAEAISESAIVVLVFSSHANGSDQIKREIGMAADASLPIIPFRIEDVQPSGSLKYFIGSAHWLDALTPQMEKGLTKLADTVGRLMPSVDGGTKDRSAARVQHYRSAVEIAWADQVVDEAEAKSLGALATRLGVTKDEKLEIEKSVLGDVIENVVSHHIDESPQRRTTTTGPAGETTPKARYCRQCGSEIIGNAKFCRKCGKPVIP